MTRSVFCLAGPTASGKSAGVLALAQRWPIEIINVDSATIYTGMDIGTAKPTPQERTRTPQHLLDIRDPAESYSAAQFVQDTHCLIGQIRARGRIPVLAGGTMMYFQALRQGLNALPQADPAIRAQIEEMARQHGWAYVHDQLNHYDPVTAARLSPNDRQRIQRMLEVCLITGQPYSSLIQEQSPRQGTDTFHIVSLEPSVRLQLHERIALRFDQMLEQGLVGEVEQLRNRGDLTEALPSIRCVGYRQIWQHLAGQDTLEGAREKAIASTRQLAKRQLTWLRSMPERQIIDSLQADVHARVIDAAAAILSQDTPEHTPHQPD
ncbi:tRNA (adenosine(37)-N6)-dimethylallyltransferase MiaA [Advenella sp. S44]|uniref:tRNA (adenosine(37)-N6)-dimethylallyltransferase MiaA n=1 Tax=Advenella sp. S44 TaxID=1982755 RepID=UPI000C29AA17|nr:tRNA (adenosine(37)-N6)-dimethylallyltransferase MiaA [Advenella sp. S44]PJX26024.1 tRNA (adenosine(37)-N6)-dimethylallyltransferase MiaA [Advenella sp. S44]